MKAEASSKVYQFKLHHNLGYGFAEVYDFTDDHPFDGCFVYVYNRIDQNPQKCYNLSDLRPSGIAIGPITLNKFPNVRGVGAWKFLFQTADLLIKDLPVTKSLRGIETIDNNWDNLKDWYQYPYAEGKLAFVPYSNVRHLETRVLNSMENVVQKFSMKCLIDEGKLVSQYYDLSNTGIKRVYIDLINTYYPLEEAMILLQQIPAQTGNIG